jgi:subtilisin family serine protease
MASFKVAASVLNLRLGPVEDLKDKSNIVGKLVNDAPFESVSEKTNSLGQWFQDVNGHWAWGGGLKANLSISVAKKAPLAVTSTIPPSEKNANWFNKLGIPDIWKLTKGRGVNIAVLDTGINLNNQELTNNLFQFSSAFLTNDIRVCKNLFDNTANVQDLFGHGTHCAALISASNTSIITAVAPDSKFFIGKISAFGEMRGYSMMTKGILWASEIEEVDIISISFGQNDEDDSFNEFVAAVNTAVSKNKIIVAAIGDKEVDPNPMFPALFESCISVGATDHLGKYWSGNVECNKTSIYAPGEEIFSHVVKNDFFIDGDTTPFPLTGSSQATAITAGIVALIVSHLKMEGKMHSSEIIKNIIRSNSDITTGEKQMRFINPLKIFPNI